MERDVRLEDITIHGHWDARFSTVKEAFADNFRKRGDVGASFAANVDGRFVEEMPLCPNLRALFLGGGSGSAVLVDRDARMSLAYVTDTCLGTLLDGDDRAAALFRAVYAAL